MSKFKQELLTRFQGTDEGEVKEYLGCEVIRDRAARTGKMVQSNQRQSSQDGQNGISIFLDMLSVYCVLLECGIAILCLLLWTQMYV
jgi:hypothetical protein